MLLEQLKTLNFDEDDVRTYLKLLETGPVTVGKLAQKTGQPRSSLYVSLGRLNERGLVSETLRSGIKTFSPEQPEKINLLYEQRIEQLKKSQDEYKKIIPELKSKHPSKAVRPKLQLFEGKEGLKQILKDMLLYYDLETFAYWPIKNMVEVLGEDFFHYLNKTRIKQRLYTRAIWPEDQILKISSHPFLGVGKDFLREIRIAPNEIKFDMGYWGYGNKCAFISSSKENLGYIIESTEMTQMLKSQFEVIWQISKPLTDNSEEARRFIKEIDLFKKN